MINLETNDCGERGDIDGRLGELQHRTKNLLAMVQALARHSDVEGRSASEYRVIFLARLDALLRAHDLAFASPDGVDLATLVVRALQPHLGGLTVEMVEFGPRVTLRPLQAQTLALVLHELATNAAKFGSLSVPHGRVRVGWEVGGTEEKAPLLLRWREEGGPAVSAPAARGFGTLLIEHAAARELRGGAELSFLPGGLRADIRVAPG